MMQLSQAALTLGAVCKGENPTFESVGTDCRTAKKGELFVALRGEHFDGHRFLAQAQAWQRQLWRAVGYVFPACG